VRVSVAGEASAARWSAKALLQDHVRLRPVPDRFPDGLGGDWQRKSTMNPQHQDDYLLLFRGNSWLKQLSDAKVQKVASEWMAGSRASFRWASAKVVVHCRTWASLLPEKRGHIVIDGPFAESKEAIGGYSHLQVSDETEAIAIAQQCPGLEYGCVVEVRPLAERCTDRVRTFEIAAASR
jgi:hypothetical protein